MSSPDVAAEPSVNENEAAPPSAPVSLEKLERIPKPDKVVHERELAVIQSEIKTIQDRVVRWLLPPSFNIREM